MLVTLSTPQEFAARNTLASLRSAGSELASENWSAQLVTPSRDVNASTMAVSQELEVVTSLSEFDFSPQLRVHTGLDSPAATAQERIAAARKYVDSKLGDLAIAA